MKNVDLKLDGDKLVITINLKKEFGPSASGKNIIIASTEGNQTIPGKEDDGIKLGLNVYRRGKK
jgi:hypothetical protein